MGMEIDEASTVVSWKCGTRAIGTALLLRRGTGTRSKSDRTDDGWGVRGGGILENGFVVGGGGGLVGGGVAGGGGMRVELGGRENVVGGGRILDSPVPGVL